MVHFSSTPTSRLHRPTRLRFPRRSVTACFRRSRASVCEPRPSTAHALPQAPLRFTIIFYRSSSRLNSRFTTFPSWCSSRTLAIHSACLLSASIRFRCKPCSRGVVAGFGSSTCKVAQRSHARHQRTHATPTHLSEAASSAQALRRVGAQLPPRCSGSPRGLTVGAATTTLSAISSVPRLARRSARRFSIVASTDFGGITLSVCQPSSHVPLLPYPSHQALSVRCTVVRMRWCGQPVSRRRR